MHQASGESFILPGRLEISRTMIVAEDNRRSVDLEDCSKHHFGIEEVTFHKRTPLVTEKAKVEDLNRLASGQQ